MEREQTDNNDNIKNINDRLGSFLPELGTKRNQVSGNYNANDFETVFSITQTDNPLLKANEEELKKKEEDNQGNFDDEDLDESSDDLERLVVDEMIRPVNKFKSALPPVTPKRENKRIRFDID